MASEVQEGTGQALTALERARFAVLKAETTVRDQVVSERWLQIADAWMAIHYADIRLTRESEPTKE